MMAWISQDLRNKIALCIFLLCIVILIYRFGWGIGVRKRLTAVYLKRTLLIMAFILALPLVILIDTLQERIIYPVIFLLLPVIVMGIPRKTWNATWLTNNRKDFRQGESIWEKIKIWVWY